MSEELVNVANNLMGSLVNVQNNLGGSLVNAENNILSQLEKNNSQLMSNLFNLLKTSPYPDIPLPLSIAVTTNAQSVSMYVLPEMLVRNTDGTFEFNTINPVVETVNCIYRDKYYLYQDNNGDVFADHSHDADGLQVIIKDQQSNSIVDFSGYHHYKIPIYKLNQMPSYYITATDPFFSVVNLDKYKNKTDLINGGFAGSPLSDKHEVHYVLDNYRWTMKFDISHVWKFAGKQGSNALPTLRNLYSLNNVIIIILDDVAGSVNGPIEIRHPLFSTTEEETFVILPEPETSTITPGNMPDNNVPINFSYYLPNIPDLPDIPYHNVIPDRRTWAHPLEIRLNRISFEDENIQNMQDLANILGKNLLINHPDGTLFRNQISVIQEINFPLSYPYYLVYRFLYGNFFHETDNTNYFFLMRFLK